MISKATLSQLYKQILNDTKNSKCLTVSLVFFDITDFPFFAFAYYKRIICSHNSAYVYDGLSLQKLKEMVHIYLTAINC